MSVPSQHVSARRRYPTATGVVPPTPGGFSLLRLLHLTPLCPLGFLLLALLIHDLFFVDAPEPPPVQVVVQQGPAKKNTPRSTAPKYSVKVEEQTSEIPRSGGSPQVEVLITDEKTEEPPVKEAPLKVEITGEDTNFVPGQRAGEIAVDMKPRLVWQYGPGFRFGITAAETGKRLTFAPNGATNQTMVSINSILGEFGSPMGMFVERDTRVPPNDAGTTFGGSQTIWVVNNVVFTQILELVPSKQPVLVDGKEKRLLDTVRVRYIIENKSKQSCKAGLRMQLDTLIGVNDGVPFAVPGLPGLVSRFADFPNNAPIPEFIQALERPNLQDPGTIAHLTLKLGKSIEPPGRVSLTHWPGAGWSNWEVPLTPMQEDSAVIMYWQAKSLKPGEKREMGFTYGLGSVSSTEPGSKLGLTLGGNFAPGETFLATAYVQNPAKNQKVTLELPEGLERVDGQETQNVAAPAAGSNASIVTWKVKVLKTGSFPIKVVSSNGQSQARTINIARTEPEAASKLTVQLNGDFEPGKEFSVEAKLVSGPQPPALVLKIPAGLMQTAGPTVDTVPSDDKKETVTTARWKVKVVEAGKYPVRVEGDNGLAVTKTLAIVQRAAPSGGFVSIALAPPFAPGKAFTLTASVVQALEGQKLTFALPPGLRFVEGQEKMAVPRSRRALSVVSWKVMVEKPGAFPLRVESSTGMAVKKTITIEQRDEQPSGGTFELAYAGDIEPGKEFKLLARVQQPVAGQKLTLKLPKQMELVDGQVTRPVPAATSGSSQVSWKVRVLDKGTLVMHVESSTGMVRTMTITLTATTPPPGEGGKQIFGGK